MADCTMSELLGHRRCCALGIGSSEQRRSLKVATQSPLRHSLRARHAAVRRATPATPAPAREVACQHLVSSHASIESELSRKWTLQNPQLIAGLKPRALGQLDQIVALTLTQVIDDLIGDARRPDTVHDQADDAEAPAGGVPLRLDGEEGIPGKSGGRTSILRPWEMRRSRSRGKYVW